MDPLIAALEKLAGDRLIRTPFAVHLLPAFPYANQDSRRNMWHKDLNNEHHDDLTSILVVPGGREVSKLPIKKRHPSNPKLLHQRIFDAHKDQGSAQVDVLD